MRALQGGRRLQGGFGALQPEAALQRRNGGEFHRGARALHGLAHCHRGHGDLQGVCFYAVEAIARNVKKQQYFLLGENINKIS
ncbi:hypothetical protein D3C72_1903660 [compost metagenome]